MANNRRHPRFADDGAIQTVSLDPRVRHMTFYSVTEGDLQLITSGNRRIAVFSSLGSILCTAAGSIWITAALQLEIPETAQLLVQYLPLILGALGLGCFGIAGVEWGSRNSTVRRIREESKESVRLT